MSDITPIDEKAPSEGDVSVRSLRGDSFIAQTSRQKKYKYSVSTAALDLDGKGYLNEVELLCRKFDKSGTGKFSINDVKLIAATLHETEKKHKKLLQRTFFIVAFFVALSAVFLGLMVTANEYSKESHIKTQNGTSSLVNLKGQTVETDRPESLVTIWALPLLSSRTLARMHHLSVYLGNGRTATYEIASAETHFSHARLLTTDGSRIDISLNDMQANVTSHGEFYTIQASEEQRATPWVFPGTKVSGDLGASYYTYDNRKPVKRSSNGRMLSEAKSTDSAASFSGSVGSLQINDAPFDVICPTLTSIGLPSCVDSCAAKCESDCENDPLPCVKNCKNDDKYESCSDLDKTTFSKYIGLWEQKTEVIDDANGQGRRRRLFLNYGCCSSGAKFAASKVLKFDADDGADCVTNSGHHISGDSLSSICLTHDVCLNKCGNGHACSTCKGHCDVLLGKQSMYTQCEYRLIDGKSKRMNWRERWHCRMTRFLLQKVFSNMKPNDCDGGATSFDSIKDEINTDHCKKEEAPCAHKLECCLPTDDDYERVCVRNKCGTKKKPWWRRWR